MRSQLRDRHPIDPAVELAEYDLETDSANGHKGQCHECGEWHPADRKTNSIVNHGDPTGNFCMGSFLAPIQIIPI